MKFESCYTLTLLENRLKVYRNHNNSAYVRIEVYLEEYAAIAPLLTLKDFATAITWTSGDGSKHMSCQKKKGKNYTFKHSLFERREET